MSRKKRIRSDHKGEFIYRHHFQNGRQKLTKIYLIDGIPSDEIDSHQFYLDNACFITLLQDGEYDELHRRTEAENGKEKYENDDMPF